jgi:hypothetical protein
MQTNHIDDEGMYAMKQEKEKGIDFDTALCLAGIVLCLIAFAVLFTVAANPVPVS